MPSRMIVGLAVIAWLALASAALVLLLGPVTVPALGLSISHPGRLLIGALVSLAGASVASRGWRALLMRLADSSVPYIATFVYGLVLLVLLLVSRGATNVGGADSAGYLAQAHRWQQGTLRVALPLAIPGAPDPWLQSGLGFRPDPSGQMNVPSYPPGLPLLQAIALRVAGEPLAVRGVPVAAALLVLGGVWLLAYPRLGADGAALSCVIVGTLPVFLFQALQPMSDVLALGLWLAALALAARAGAAGVQAVAGAAAAAPGTLK